jgi:hypothetical protein
MVSRNKFVHLAGTAFVTSAVTLSTKDATLGIMAGVGTGLIREFYKIDHNGRCEWASVAYDAVGIALGSYGSRVVIAPHWIGYQIEFK